MNEPLRRSAALIAVLGVGLIARLMAALVVERLARQRGAVCLFPDADLYWQLSGSLLRGEPYRVMQWGVPHDSLRTPGFPLFLAACRGLFGDSTLAARLAQVGLGVLAIGLVALLVKQVRPCWRIVMGVAVLTALDPFVIGFTALLLSEAVFLPLLLATLLGLAGLWPGDRAWGRALVTGAAAGGAILVKPSFALFVPLALAAWLASVPRWGTARIAGIVALGVVLVMAPWWARNAWVHGRFVATALWGGASLYDGLNPEATGASDMRFLEEPDLRRLDELAQDVVLRARAWRFVREHPGRVLELAGIKAARFWSPWLNAEGFRSRWLALATALWTVPVYALTLVGLWDRRRDGRALVLLAGPVLYFAVLHLIFVGSVRYRVPAIVPALGLAAIGGDRLARRGDREPAAGTQGSGEGRGR